MTLLVTIAVLTGFFVAAAIYSHVCAQHITNGTWEDIVARIQPVPAEGIAAIALDHRRGSSKLRLMPDEMWQMVGGMDGLRRMKQNADAMIALAAYAERRNDHKNMIIAERVRQDGLIVRRAVRSIRVARVMHVGAGVIPERLQQAAHSYELMKQRMPALCSLSMPGYLPA
jgi:hypothetical protein